MRYAIPLFMTAPLLWLTACGEQATIEVYESTLPVGYSWPETEPREVVYEVEDLNWVWEVPAGWIDAPEVPAELVADYRFKGTSESLPGRMTVSMIAGEGGGVDANVQRWLQQMYITTVRGLGPRDRVSEPMSISYGEAVFVELNGQYQGEHTPTHMSAAIVQIPAEGGGVFQTWFFKMVGDRATVDANRLGLAQIILSFRPEGAAAPDLPDDFAGPGEAVPPPAEDAEDASGETDDPTTPAEQAY